MYVVQLVDKNYLSVLMCSSYDFVNHKNNISSDKFQFNWSDFHN